MQKNVWQLLTCVAANSVPENALVPCVVHYKKTSEVYKMPLNMTWGTNALLVPTYILRHSNCLVVSLHQSHLRMAQENTYVIGPILRKYLKFEPSVLCMKNYSTIILFSIAEFQLQI